MSERLNKENFTEAVKKEGLVLVDFYSDSCIPCKKINPVLSQLEESLGESLAVYKVNTNFDMELVEKYGIMSTPTLVLFKDGAEKDRKNGFQTVDTLEDWIQTNK